MKRGFSHNCEIIDDCDSDSVFNRIFMDENEENGHKEDVPMEIEPFFKVENAYNPTHSNLYSFADLLLIDNSRFC